jgi:hypothetical protein
MEISGRNAVAYVAVAVVGVGIGFFAGREEMKYEIRSAFQDVQKGIASVLGGGSTSTRTETQAPPAPKIHEPAPIGIKLVKKGFKPSNPRASDYEDDITLEFGLTDLTNKDIRAFDGTVVFSDLLDNTLMSISLAVNDPVKAGDTLDWSGGIKYNQFIDAHQRLRNTEQQNIKVSFKTKKILFADGTTTEYQ